MFITYMSSGKDPFSDMDILRHFEHGHPVLEYISELGFDWPSTYITTCYESEIDNEKDWTKVGVLRYFGYKTGSYGLSAKERRKILNKVYYVNIPLNNFSKEYVKEWGEPDSSTRLRKMANALSSFCKNQKRKNNRLSASHFEADLKWLKKNYYKPPFRFKWPSAVFVR